MRFTKLTFLIIKPTTCTIFSNLFCKKTLHVSQSSSVHHQEFSLYTQQKYMSYRFADSLRAESGCSILILLACCQQTCMTYTFAVCTVKNSWWWTEELFETCRVFFQNKFEKIVHVLGFIIRNSSRCTVILTSKTDIVTYRLWLAWNNTISCLIITVYSLHMLQEIMVTTVLLCWLYLCWDILSKYLNDRVTH